MNIGTIIIAVCYILSAITTTIGAFLVSTPLGFLSIGLFLLVISIVLYKELAEGSEN